MRYYCGSFHVKTLHLLVIQTIHNFDSANKIMNTLYVFKQTNKQTNIFIYK